MFDPHLAWCVLRRQGWGRAAETQQLASYVLCTCCMPDNAPYCLPCSLFRKGLYVVRGCSSVAAACRPACSLPPSTACGWSTPPGLFTSCSLYPFLPAGCIRWDPPRDVSHALRAGLLSALERLVREGSQGVAARGGGGAGRGGGGAGGVGVLAFKRRPWRPACQLLGPPHGVRRARHGSSPAWCPQWLTCCGVGRGRRSRTGEWWSCVMYVG